MIMMKLVKLKTEHWYVYFILRQFAWNVKDSFLEKKKLEKKVVHWIFSYSGKGSLFRQKGPSSEDRELFTQAEYLG